MSGSVTSDRRLTEAERARHTSPRAAQPQRGEVRAVLGDVPPIRVVLADDHKILREGIAGILGAHRDIRIVAEAADGREAVQLAHEHRPEVVVMDITMPALDGIEATRRITGELPGIVVLGLSMHDSDDMALAMRQAGAARLLVKDGPCEGLIHAIREAVRPQSPGASQGE